MLIGYGPSKAQIITKNNITFVRKMFSIIELDRRNKEVQKLSILKEISKKGVFSVPKVINIGIDDNSPFYDLEYINNASELNNIGHIFSSYELSKKLLDIIDLISSYDKPLESVWDIMLQKFKQVKTENTEYNDLINKLPLNMEIKCSGYSHGDMSFDNILYSEGEFYLIDPSWSQVENPLWDVGKILQSVLINWDGIKRCNRADGSIREEWLNDLIYNKNDKTSLVKIFIEMYGLDPVILCLACQLSRVSRWCFSDILIPVINKLLKIHFNQESKSDYERINSLCWVI